MWEAWPARTACWPWDTHKTTQNNDHKNLLLARTSPVQDNQMTKDILHNAKGWKALGQECKYHQESTKSSFLVQQQQNYNFWAIVLRSAWIAPHHAAAPPTKCRWSLATRNASPAATCPCPTTNKCGTEVTTGFLCRPCKWPIIPWKLWRGLGVLPNCHIWCKCTYTAGGCQPYLPISCKRTGCPLNSLPQAAVIPDDPTLVQVYLQASPIWVCAVVQDPRMMFIYLCSRYMTQHAQYCSVLVLLLLLYGSSSCRARSAARLLQQLQ